jgi:hypothetical protein
MKYLLEYLLILYEQASTLSSFPFNAYHKFLLKTKEYTQSGNGHFLAEK